MKKYRIITAIIAFYVISSAIVLMLNPTWNVEAGMTPKNIIADVLLIIEMVFLAIGALAFVGYKIYRFIKYSVLKKNPDEDIDDYVIKSRSYRSKYDE